MTKASVFILSILVLGMISHNWVLNEYELTPGGEMIGHIGVWNNDDDEIKNVDLTFEILGTGIFRHIRTIDILPRTNYGQYYFFDLPWYMNKGTYVLKVSAESEEGTRVSDTSYKHIYLR